MQKLELCHIVSEAINSGKTYNHIKSNILEPVKDKVSAALYDSQLEKAQRDCVDNPNEFDDQLSAMLIEELKSGKNALASINEAERCGLSKEKAVDILRNYKLTTYKRATEVDMTLTGFSFFTEEDVPEIKYILPDLKISIGTTTLISGYGNTGKSIFCSALALSCIHNMDFMSRFPFQENGNVLHLDFDSPDDSTMKKYYHQVQNGLLQQSNSWGAKPQFQVFPKTPNFKLDQHDSEKILTALINSAKAKIVIIDSLRASCDIDDNKSNEVRPIMDLISRVASATQSAIIVLHHEAKTTSAGDNAKAAKGSEAITSACGTYIRLEAVDGTINVYNPRARSEKFLPWSYQLAASGEIVKRFNSKSTLELVMIDAPGMMAETQTIEGKMKVALNYIASNEDCKGGEVDDIINASASKKSTIKKRLVDDGFVTVKTVGKATLYRITDAGKTFVTEAQ